MIQSITVLGAGESGIGAALLAKKKGIDVFVSDYGKISDSFKSELQKNKIPFEEMGHSFDKIESTKLIVKSPGIPASAEVIKYFRLRNKSIISEIEFASRYYSGKIAAITGSNGKTTTTSLTYEILKDSNFKVAVGGNIGYSFARLISEDKEYDWVVLELSSFQLDDLIDFQADISAILNISPDHLDRYDYNFNMYAQAKWNLAKHTRTDGKLILNEDDESCHLLFKKFPVDTDIIWLSANNPNILVSKDTNEKFEISLFGKHNIYNAAVAKTIAEEINIDSECIKKGLFNFQPIEHRLEKVIENNNVLYINDSKATNLDSAEVALHSFKRIIWIVGGVDKGNDYNKLLEYVEKNVIGIICLCKDDSKLRETFDNKVKKIKTVDSMKNAVELANKWAQKDSVILLSPACASFDLFDNYIHRGLEFKKEVFKLINEINK